MFDFLKNLFGGNASPSAYTNLNAHEFGEKLQSRLLGTEGGVLLDVRTLGEYQSGHLENALYADISNGGLLREAAKLDKAKPVFVYCRSGARSTNACAILEKQGFTQIYHLKTGILSWRGKIVK